MRYVRFAANPIIIAAIVAVAAIAAAVALVSTHESDPGNQNNVFATASAEAGGSGATPTPSADQAAVVEAVDRFVAALASGDADTLYALQTDAYKQSCSRQQFDAIAAAMKGQTLLGPASVQVQGNDAAVRLVTDQNQPVVLPMHREADGSWRVVARAKNGCA